MSNSNLFLSIGKPIKNEYGRIIGKVASFALNPNGKFEAVYIEFGDGEFSKQSMDSLRFDGDEIIFISKIKSQANVLCDQIPLIWRKDEALKDLLDKKKIAPEIYQELHSSFENVLTQLKKEAQVIVDEAAIEIERCQEESTSLSYAIANLEIEHEIGKVDDESYEAAFTLLQDTLRRATSERKDYELIKSKISSVLLGDQSQTQLQAQSQTQTKTNKIYAEQVDAKTKLPEPPAEPPVVVYVKEVGKASI
ncbi:MAG: CdvA-like protein [Candidatus Bathyarchaeota archaeon]|nr:CdvA-like protein [Candidatus Bathyarchaeota archaeon]MDD4325453.1 CdvA-like protein [Candidatus Bathyarchaeota archaeon]MDI9578627.1 CdvA-like protein [Thermoproteota archaeon]MDT8782317.1 CdvA-like protein [Candidatus Bathyarchaeota archaeon]